jgi:hypothetical protein
MKKIQFSKKIYYIFVLLTFTAISFSLQSCKDEKNSTITENSNSITPTKEVVVDVLQEKDMTQYAENIYNSNNAEFIGGEYVQKAVPQKIMRRINTTDQPDTITHADEIPISRSEIVIEQIYSDGGYYYQSIDNTSPDKKLIETLNVNKQPENEKVVKTEIKDNVVSLYNPSGTVIKSQPINNMNLKPILDSLKHYLASQQNTLQKTPQIKSAMAMKKAMASGMKIIGQTADEIIVEKEMVNQQSLLPYKVKTMVTRRAVMSFTPDMTRMNYQKLYENGQLVNQISYTFADNTDENFKNAYSGVTNQLLPNANLKRVINKKLSFKTDGTPFVQNHIEIYRKNAIKYNLK